MPIKMYRHENLVEVNNYKTSPADVDELVEQLRSKWAFLRDSGWAADNPVLLLRGDDTVTEVFSWISDEARVLGDLALSESAGAEKAGVKEADFPGLERARVGAKRIKSLAGGGVDRRRKTEVLRGFQANFPKTGGDELLTGVCDCVLDIAGVVKGYTFRAVDGVVLMHRSARADQDNDGKMEMYLHIHEHGCKGSTISGIGNVRIVQNHLLPNDGLVKSLGEGTDDFPAMAIWRVAWKLVTPFATFMTDPQTPLVFGPTKVTHYPPVGTEFHSPTGPVDLLEEKSGRKVGTLTPMELTAFDIRHTMDDSRRTPLLEAAPPSIFELLWRHS